MCDWVVITFIGNQYREQLVYKYIGNKEHIRYLNNGFYYNILRID